MTLIYAIAAIRQTIDENIFEKPFYNIHVRKAAYQTFRLRVNC